jgi:hypothetical protein
MIKVRAIKPADVIQIGDKFWNYNGTREFTVMSVVYGIDAKRHFTYQAENGQMQVSSEDSFRECLYIKVKNQLKPGDVFHFETLKYSDILFLYVSDNSVIRLGQGANNSRYFNVINRATLSCYVKQAGDNDYNNIVVLKNINIDYNVTVS